MSNTDTDTTTATTTDTRCHSCRVEADVLAGTATRADANHWSMWGCTCDESDAADAAAWFDRVTR